MNKYFVAAAAAGSIVMLLVGFLMYGVVFAALFQEGALSLPGVMREQPRVLWILVGQAGMGVLLTLVIHWRGSTSLAGGAWTGVVFGLLMAIGYDFAHYGTSNLWSLRATLADPFITAVLFGVSGAAVGYVLGQSRSVRPRE